ncbi:MAG: adenylate/guanylate cyclase domain-containing protein, partial [Mycobacterium sp.]
MKDQTGTRGQVVESLDFDGLEAAGIADAQARSGLIRYLTGLGF